MYTITDGRVPIDNGEVERRIRPIAMARRNWLFAGPDEGPERAASIYSLLASCSLANVEPQAWMAEVLSRLCQGWPNRCLVELLPEHWTPPRQIPPATVATSLAPVP